MSEKKPRKKATGKTKKSGQTGQSNAIVVQTPFAIKLAKQKSVFIEHLTQNGGNVSDALKSSGLSRNVAYTHFGNDEQFAADWLNAQEESFDELFAEGRRRAVVGDLRVTYVEGRKIETYVKSDALLIHLLKTAENNKKWRNRLIQTGNLALEAVTIAARKHNLSDEVIKDIQNQMTMSFKQIQFV